MDDEIRDGHLVTAKMKRIWNIQLNMVMRLFEVCKKYNLRIWADGGTLLGAVRHKGFIPWDDDIDLSMPRADYDKLVEVAPKEFKAPFFFQSFTTDKYYFCGFAKLRYDGTCMMERFEMNLPDCKKHMGIFIDIFILDKVPSENTNLYLSRITNYSKLIYDFVKHRSELHYLFLPHRILALIQESFKLKRKALWSRKKLFSHLEELHRNEKDPSELYSLVSFDNNPKLIRDSSSIESTLYLPFETIDMPVMNGYKNILTNYYGDYMTPIKGTQLHFTGVIDPEKPYTYYLKQIRINYLSLLLTSCKLVFKTLTSR